MEIWVRSQDKHGWQAITGVFHWDCAGIDDIGLNVSKKHRQANSAYFCFTSMPKNIRDIPENTKLFSSSDEVSSLQQWIILLEDLIRLSVSPTTKEDDQRVGTYSHVFGRSVCSSRS